MKKSTSRPGPGRPSKIEDPVSTIRAEASALIATRGYSATSLQDVASAVGMTKAGLYHYFPTKQALFEAIVLSALQDLQAGARSAIAAQRDHNSKLIAFMVAHARYLEEHNEEYRASFFGRAGDGMEAYSQEQLASRKGYVQILENLLEKGVSEGVMSIDDIPTLARGILGMLNWIARWYRSSGPKTASEIAETYATTLLCGIATQ